MRHHNPHQIFITITPLAKQNPQQDANFRSLFIKTTKKEGRKYYLFHENVVDEALPHFAPGPVALDVQVAFLKAQT
jgi:hypothetical protein